MAKYSIRYEADDGTQAVETFETTGNEPPPGAYAAIGMHGVQPGMLYKKRCCRGGTCLIPVDDEQGNWARVAPQYAGKTFIDGRWRNE